MIVVYVDVLNELFKSVVIYGYLYLVLKLFFIDQINVNYVGKDYVKVVYDVVCNCYIDVLKLLRKIGNFIVGYYFERDEYEGIFIDRDELGNFLIDVIKKEDWVIFECLIN